MRLLKLVAIPAVIALLVAPTVATDTSIRSKILANINRPILSQTGELSQKDKDKYVVSKGCINCYTPCHVKMEENDGKCPKGDKYDPDDFKRREKLYHFTKVTVEVEETTDSTEEV